MSQPTLRRVARLQRGAGFAHQYQGVSAGDLPFFKVGDFGSLGNERYLHSCDNWVSKETAKNLRAVAVRSGSVLLPKIGAALLGNARRIATQQTVFDNNVLAVVPESINEGYLYYLLSTLDLAQLANPGPIPSLDDSALLDQRVPCGDASEQGAIADYLDTETARIDTLITKKRQLIELLNERWVAKVVDATSNPGSSCDQVALRRVIESTIGGVWGTEAGEGDLDVLCIRGTDFDTSSLLADKEGAPIRGLTHQEFRGRRLVDGDLLIEKSGGGENQPVGRVIQWCGGDAAVPTNFAARLRPAARIDSRYLVFVFRAAYEIGHTRAWIKQITGIQNLDLGGLLSEKCQIPSFADQVATAKRLDEATTDRLRVVTLLNHQADLLAEHRQALITAAVTGEIAMPGVAA